MTEEIISETPVLSAPFAEVSPVPDTNQDLGELHVERKWLVADEHVIERARRRLEENPPPREEAETPTEEPIPEGRSVGADIALGAVQAPLQVAGGAIDAVTETFDMAREFNDFVTEEIGPLLGGGVIVGGDFPFVRFASGDEIKNTETLARAILPEIDKADTTTGNMVRGVAQFLTGYLTAGRLKALQSLAGAGRAGQAAVPLAQGAIADFAVFDPGDAGLANLLNEVPVLKEVVPDFMNIEKEGGAAENRLKRAIEGLGLGVAAEGLFRVLKLARSARKAKVGQTSEEAVAQQLIDTVETQRARYTELLGDVEAPRFEVRGAEVSDEVAARIAAGEVAPTPDGVFINWSRIDSPEDVKAVMQEMANANKEGIDVARRGVRSWQATKLSAEKLDAFEILENRTKGAGLNAEETIVVRELWARSGSKLKQTAEAVRADPSDLNKIAFRKMLAIHNSIQNQVIAARTETARALNAWRAPAGNSVEFAGQMEQLQSLARLDADAEDIATRLLLLEDAGLSREADAFAYGSLSAKGAGMVRQLWYASLLSGPHTHMRNMGSGVGIMGIQMLERKAANLIGQAFGQENIPSGETTALFYGMAQGIRDAFRVSAKGRQILKAAAEKRLAGDAAGARELVSAGSEEFGTFFRAAATGQSGFGVGKLEVPRVGAFSPERLQIDAETPLGHVMSFIDTATTMPGRALGAEDEIFKTIFYGMELRSLAFRKASREVSEGKIPQEQFADRLTTLMNNPDEAMQLASRQSAGVNTFTQQLENTRAWTSFKALGTFPVLGKIVAPFQRTAFAIGHFSFQRTPLAPFVKSWREDLTAGGARTDLAWSKFLTGNALLLAVADLAMSGHITGKGPVNPSQRATDRRAGVQPMSVRFETSPGEFRYFTYRGMEPISTTLGLAANLVEILQQTDWDSEDAEIDELIIAASMAIASHTTSQQYMSGVSGFFDAMSDPKRHGERWWMRLAGSAVVPTAAAQMARFDDPFMREVGSMMDAIRARTPGLSDDLPFRRDLWGREITRESGVGDFYDAISPIYSTKFDQQPIDKELTRLETWVSKPKKRVNFGGVAIDLTDDLDIYSRYVELQGNTLTHTTLGVPVGLMEMGLMDELNSLVTGSHPMSPIYGLENMTDGPGGGRAMMIKEMIRNYQAAARDQILVEFPGLKAKVDKKRAEKPTRFKFD